MEKEVEGILVTAHELKAPLAVLRQLALSLDNLDSENEHIRDEMIGVSERAIKQVTDLTKIHRLEKGLFEMEPVAIRPLCNDVSRELECLFRDSHRQLNIHYSNKSQLVNANRELLWSVIYNFLLNAVHYSAPGAQTKLTVRDTHGKVRVSIRDFGPALSIDIWRQLKAGHLNQPTSIAMRPGSSGLGLYIASKFSHYMHADVGAVRHRDGASFYVELPVSRQASLFI